MFQDISIISTTDPLAAGLKIIAALRKGEVVAMRADRTLSGRVIPVRLLGEPVNLPAGPFAAATLAGARVLYVYTCRIGRRKYRCIIAPGPDVSADSTPESAAAHFAAHLESLLHQFPAQWSNFYDLWQAQKPAMASPP